LQTKSLPDLGRDLGWGKIPLPDLGRDLGWGKIPFPGLGKGAGGWGIGRSAGLGIT